MSVKGNSELECCLIYFVTPKPGRQVFVNIEKICNKYEFLMVRFMLVVHPPKYGEIWGFYDKIRRFPPIKDIIRNAPKMGLFRTILETFLIMSLIGEFLQFVR